MTVIFERGQSGMFMKGVRLQVKIVKVNARGEIKVDRLEFKTIEKF